MTMRKYKVWGASVLVAVSLIVMSGCSVLSEIESYTKENPVLVTIATKQAVFRYIDAGEDLEHKQERAGHVQAVLTQVQDVLEGDPKASPQTLFYVVKSNVNLEKLAVADRLLVEDIFTAIELSLEQDPEQIGSDEPIHLRVLLRTLLSTSRMFL